MELQIFKNEQFGQVQLLEINTEPWFVGKEIAEILGYKNSRDALSKHVDEEDKGVAKRDTLGGSQDQVIINESGLYSLILKSKLPQAKQFKRWVTSEVLPSIRKHGGYLTDNKLEEALLNPDTLISLATQLKEEREARKQLQVANSQLMVDNQIMQPKAQYFDDLVARNLLTSFRDTAKMLKIKEREFINWLLDKKFLYRDKKGKLVPFANKNDGLFEIKETKNESTAWKGTQTLVTPKGRETFNILLRV
ncbi:phage antirepressor KilAC domain-containing protein [Streptococcus suis]|uniref:BRO family protein n=1 Tax=Streptococcus suis TaxID=1307 RepID=UPI001478CB67|nr:BRO family protein [Streptococcus suis]MBL6503185.1 phage antirepressor KilAC domain-containing protein [Streptococcus suis]MBM0241175.1 phage antirepressor KilAC domain-containing protein [Streptococcus suis]MBM7153939.1 phage antirepressor KilAC domain-containing protein [Streptococcus suis]MBM7204470.1 phage antirepressor KilAC domain-containing protein [Streptococcus suis]MBM7281357.1 phage antirepressor KilAC domain-containing protein [Streptococcus suis]